MLLILDGLYCFDMKVSPPPKFNSSPRNPIGKDRLPTTIFEGRTVKLRGCSFFESWVTLAHYSYPLIYDLIWSILDYPHQFVLVQNVFFESFNLPIWLVQPWFDVLWIDHVRKRLRSYRIVCCIHVFLVLCLVSFLYVFLKKNRTLEFEKKKKRTQSDSYYTLEN